MLYAENQGDLTIIAVLSPGAAEMVFTALFDGGLTPVYIQSRGNLTGNLSLFEVVSVAVPHDQAAEARLILHEAQRRRRAALRTIGDRLRRRTLVAGLVAVIAAGVMRTITGQWTNMNWWTGVLFGIGAFIVTGAIFRPPAPDEDSDTAESSHLDFPDER